MGSQFVQGISSLVKGLLLGFLIVMLFVAGLITCSVIVSAEAPDVFQHPSPEVLALHDALDDLGVVFIEIATVIEVEDCERANEWLEFALEYIQQSIRRNPSTAYIYADTIKVLEESGCEE